MSLRSQIIEVLRQMLEFLAAPGNLVRALFETGSEPWATLGVSSVFVFVFVLIFVFEMLLRKWSDRAYVLLPNYLLTAPPDLGVNTWGIILFWALIQGPLSAIV